MATPAAVTTAPPASGTSAATTPAVDKIPKTLPAGVWMSLVKAYNEIQLNGRDRSFPVAELLGSECVVARMWREHNVSKLYTPVGLGEIIQRRSFTASGDVNPFPRSLHRSALMRRTSSFRQTTRSGHPNPFWPSLMGSLQPSGP